MCCTGTMATIKIREPFVLPNSDLQVGYPPSAFSAFKIPHQKIFRSQVPKVSWVHTKNSCKAQPKFSLLPLKSFFIPKRGSVCQTYPLFSLIMQHRVARQSQREAKRRVIKHHSEQNLLLASILTSIKSPKHEVKEYNERRTRPLCFT